MSSSPGGEEEIRRLLAAYQQYQAQAEAVVRQISLTQLTAEGLDRALHAVEAWISQRLDRRCWFP